MGWPNAPIDSTFFSAKIVNAVACSFVAESSLQSGAFKQHIANATAKMLLESAAVTGKLEVSQVTLTQASAVASKSSVVALGQTSKLRSGSTPHALATSSRHTEVGDDVGRAHELPWVWVISGLCVVLCASCATQLVL